MAGLVQHAEERGGEIRLVVTGGQAHVARAERGAEWMGGGVDAAGVEIKADGRGDFGVEALLRGNRIGTRRQSRGRGQRIWPRRARRFRAVRGAWLQTIRRRRRWRWRVRSLLTTHRRVRRGSPRARLFRGRCRAGIPSAGRRRRSPSVGGQRPTRVWPANWPWIRGRPVRRAVWWRGRTRGGVRAGWR